MNFKKQLALVMLVGLVSCSMMASISVMGFASDSFAQKTGDEYIWEVTTYVEGAAVDESLKGVGIQWKAVIVEANTTYIGPCHWWDCLWIAFYNNSPSNPEWTLRFPTDLRFNYNNSLGYNLGLEPVFIPRNETAVVQAFNDDYSSSTVVWTSGPHGYDGIFNLYDGNGTGDPGESREKYEFNSAGVAIYIEFYNGTGSGWDLTFQMDLQEKSPISGFLLNAIFVTLSFFIAIYAVDRLMKRERPL